MKHLGSTKWILSSLLVVVLCCPKSLFGVTFRENDQRIPVDLLWERLLTDGDLRLYNDPTPEQDDLLQGPYLKDNYPQLSREAAEFGVNPSYNSFYEPSLKKIELEERNPMSDEMLERKRLDDENVDQYQLEVARKMNEKKAEISMLPRALSSTHEQDIQRSDIFFISIVAGISALAVMTIVGAGFCYHKVQKNSRAGEEVEYPAYGVTGPGKEISPTSGDRKLAQSAQMYHYQHQKQQMIAFDRSSGSERGTPTGGIKGGPRSNVGAMLSDGDSDDGEEGDYTVYECPGLAPTGEMEVRNPLFQDDNETPKNGRVP
ncbi:uncharacterized protein [Lepeophtheirus salmonis]|uniref:Putative LOC100159902 [Acyrthosiphon pisum] n=1 Tax=Lepeophtheirus salmonis TaxID=72036 RepID=A0A0K2UU64_LEPSM|nr:protein cab-1-like [Lepeophtheirus salmonis]